ncbi:MAG: carbon-nitrogen hydrolase family protein [Tenuifilaceae bacterium]
MKIGFLQFNVVFKNPEANRSIIEEQLIDKNFDLVVLPELFTTGYLLGDASTTKHFAENVPDGPTVKLLEKISKKTGGYIIGSLLELDKETLYNTAVVIGPEGFIGKQRKLNPTDYESKFSSAGDKIEIFTIKGVKVGIAICFDCWFSELARYYYHHDVQILCHTANYGGIQSPVISQARAIENRMFVISCNRTGTESDNSIEAYFRGESRVIDPEGNILIQADRENQFEVVEVDPNLAKDKNLDFSLGYNGCIKRTKLIAEKQNKE